MNILKFLMLVVGLFVATSMATVLCICTSDTPTVSTGATANPNPIYGTNTTLSVLGADDGGESALIYNWEKICGPSIVNFSINGNNVSKSCVATFQNSGSYTLRVSIKDAQKQIVTSDINIIVNANQTSISISPSSVTLSINTSKQFTATAKDQFNIPMNPQPFFTWSVSSAGGIINSKGLFTAGSVPMSCTVTASAISQRGTANIIIR